MAGAKVARRRPAPSAPDPIRRAAGGACFDAAAGPASSGPPTAGATTCAGIRPLRRPARRSAPLDVTAIPADPFGTVRRGPGQRRRQGPAARPHLCVRSAAGGPAAPRRPDLRVRGGGGDRQPAPASGAPHARRRQPRSRRHRGLRHPDPRAGPARAGPVAARVAQPAVHRAGAVPAAARRHVGRCGPQPGAGSGRRAVVTA
jgi:hypothetical protein